METFLKMEPCVDYRKKISFDAKKGAFDCQITKNNYTKYLPRDRQTNKEIFTLCGF